MMPEGGIAGIGGERGMCESMGNGKIKVKGLAY
jgi:hypothetical protein